MTFAHALTLGKFYPPHLGHLHLIEAACRSADTVTVLVLAAATEGLPLDVRVEALRTTLADAGSSNARVLGVLEDSPVDFECPAAWDAHLAVDLAALASIEGRSIAPLRESRSDPFDAPVDAVFTSEEYGAELARRLGATHVAVDPERRRVPVRGAEIRSAIATPMEASPSPTEVARRLAWSHLLPASRAALTRRICLVGAESTGKTTLARALAAHYDTTWVTEYGRFYTERRVANAAALGHGERPWTAAEFALICRQQQADEDRLAAAADTGPVLICDTDAMATAIWQHRYTGRGSWEVEAAAAARTYTAYLLTSPVGVAWEDDGLRDGEHERDHMHRQFVQRLQDRTAVTGEPWLMLVGSPAERLSAATTFLAPLLPITLDRGCA